VTRLSLCIIARNEEAELPDCLASVRGAVDQVVVVDTGSTDRTRELAQAAGALVLDRPWDDDFAAPRNLAARHATGDFILVMDADERLAAGAGRTLRALLRRPAFDLGMVRLHNAARREAPAAAVLSGAARTGGPILLPRVVRRTEDLEWRGAIHENVADWMLRGQRRRALLPVDLIHYGYLPDVLQARGKRERNQALLRRRIELEPDDVTPSGYLALELIEDGRYDEAREVMDRAWPLVERQPAWRCLARPAVARGILALRRTDAEGVLEAARVGEGRNGPHPDFDFLRGMALEIQALRAPAGGPARAELLEAAEAAYLSCARRLDEEGPFELVAAASPARARLQLGGVRYLRGRWPEALRACSEALQLEPASPDARIGAAEVLVELGRAAQALEILQPALGALADAWLVAASAAHRLGALEDARLFLGKARGLAAGGYQRIHRRLRQAALEAALAPPAAPPPPAPHQ